MTRSILPCLLALLSGCVAIPTGLQGRWVGTVTPVSGTCDPASHALLMITPADKPPYTAMFSPTGGVLTLHGSSDGVDHVTADSDAPGMNHQPYVLRFDATRQADTLTGTYLSPRCRANVVLSRG